MALVRWEPFREIDTLRRQMDRLFDDVTSLTGTERSERSTWAPAVELRETEDAVVLRAEVPGVEAKNLDVQVSRDAVSIAGEHHQEQRTEEKGLFRTEFRYGSFRRVVPLPAQVQNDQVKAEFKDGILTLTLPKAEDERRKVVKVTLDSAQS
ncbi:Hsp20/alpha crystallin family protein [Leptolyngbya sp. FACHB-261]|uniref:Hsp20/alpha crystallin family protein n=1 Tax=Leptolyngbya sp. FACHB-261 TaxID=2692806 RepID=UPI001683A44E|nr:Hsp20/alpha crystallin family protein [Leptolyngbya sp. FACHB-261]MBD2099547.1 Hsp20/alpha crystallin family protein [Leptolyngbya sp. FACHB-261]